MHYTLAVIFQVESEDLIDEMRGFDEASKEAALETFAGKLEKPMRHFDVDLEVGVYKKYLSPTTIEGMKKEYGTENIKELALHVGEWTGEEGGVDQKGLYSLSTENPEGHFDSWYVFDVVPAVDLLEKIDRIDRTPRAVLLPDLQWIDSDLWIYADTDPPQQQRLDAWVEKMKNIFQQHAKSLVVLIDCHI